MKPHAALCNALTIFALAIATLFAAGCGGTDEFGSGDAGDAGALRRAMDPNLGAVVHNVLEQGDRYEMMLDPGAIAAQQQMMLTMLTAYSKWVAQYTDVPTWYEFRADGCFYYSGFIERNSCLDLYTIGTYYRASDGKALPAACVGNWSSAPELFVVDGSDMAMGSEASPNGVATTGLFRAQ